MSREEWNYLKQQHLPDLTDNATEQQRTFLELIMGAAKRLFNYMEISNEDAASHRLYDAEIIDLTEDVSFIVICPPAEFSCLVPGKKIDHDPKLLFLVLDDYKIKAPDSNTIFSFQARGKCSSKEGIC